MGVDMLGMAIFAVGAVGDDEIRLNFFDIITDRPGKIIQGNIDPAGDAVDFHVRVNVGKKEDIVNAKSLCSLPDLLLTEGSQVLAVG